jgi:SAM-dependent methyltransferase
MVSGRPIARSGVPTIFSGVDRQTIRPAAVTRAQGTFNEAALYAAIQGFAREWYQTARRPAHVLELCSSTALCSLRVKQAIHVSKVTVVDLDPKALVTARRRLGNAVAESITGDAVTFSAGGHFDLILANSAYHHIPDRRKQRFLANVARHLREGGAALVGDHFLKPYNSCRAFRRAVVDFYGALLEELDARGEDRQAVEVIRQAAYQCWCGETEFKVSWEIFERDATSAGLEIVSRKVVWRPAGAEDFPIVGSVAVALRRQEGG